jgi:hypothetical protein
LFFNGQSEGIFGRFWSNLVFPSILRDNSNVSINGVAFLTQMVVCEAFLKMVDSLGGLSVYNPKNNFLLPSILINGVLCKRL